MATLVAGRQRRRACAAILTCCFVSASAPSEVAATDSRVYLPAAVEVAAVQKALAGARRRLDTASCQGLFDEFESQQGQPLAAVLDTLGQTRTSYLDLLSFYNGDGTPACRNRQLRAMAYTTPGSRVIFICPGFADVHHRYTDEAEATLIHETLHSLGLGENPPSSRHIQDRVRQRCPSVPAQRSPIAR